MAASSRGLRLLYGLAALGALVADQATKLWIVAALGHGERIPVVPALFYITNIRNTGGAFGLFRSLPEGLRSLLFLLLPAAILVALLVVSLRCPARPAIHQVALALILGGALGNFVDRIRLEYVVDFLLFHWRDTWLRWPAFNLADVCITVGVALLLLGHFREERREREAGGR
jgi:signal peptidase II